MSEVDGGVWVPDRGMLVARVKLTPDKTVIEYCVRVDDVKFHFTNIARFDGFFAQRSAYVFYEGVRRVMGLADIDGVVHRHYCRDDELLFIKRFWDDPDISLAAWLRGVLRMKGLDEQEKNRLARVLD